MWLSRRPIVAICVASALIGVVQTVGAFAQTASQEISPLFLSDDPLEITIETDLGQLMKDRSQESEYRPARFSFISESGDSLSFDAQVKTRGNFRLKRTHCDFPPVKLNLKKKEMGGTPFEGHDKFKLVTHCQTRRNSYEEYLLQEYLVYRTYNLLTDASFNVRLARTTYVDSEGNRDPIQKFAFLVEDEEVMAERNNASIIEQKGIRKEVPSQRDMMTLSVFQYLIGNTDWSVPALHNIKLLRVNDQSVLLAVPYDFDFSGVINARYSTPDPKLGLESVEERMYRGVCQNHTELEPILDIFRQKKDEIYTLYDGFPYLSDKVKRRTLNYFDEFYDTINNSRRAKAEFEDRCTNEIS